MEDKDKDPVKIISICIKNKFYGDVTLKFREGKVVHVVKAESIKLD